MKKYSIIPLLTNNVDEVCNDIIRQYNDDIATEALFIMTLTPEGDPVIDKSAILCEEYKMFSDNLASKGYRAGVLVQATIGHGYRLAKKAPFTHQISLMNGESTFRICPYDEGFRAYIKDAFAKIAACNPTSIMVDDDFRLFATSHKGCACHLHMAELSKRIGRKIDRDELIDTLNRDTPEAQSLMNVFYETQVDSLIGAARAMREGIDSVDKTIPGTFCLCGSTCEGAREIAEILAGEGNPTVIRIHNGNYTPDGAKYITKSAQRCATQMAVVGKEGVTFLAETDTCPQNRYSTSAANLHAHFSISILEGVAGCKHWITKTNNFEPKSGEAYRKKLAKYAGFYEELCRTVADVEWQGCKIPLPKKAFVPHVPVAKFEYPSDYIGWSSCVLERLGLPLYFSERDGGAVCLEEKMDVFFSDEELKQILSGTVFLSIDAAKSLINRGFGKYIGVDVESIPKGDFSARKEIVGGKNVSLPVNLHKLIPSSDGVISRSDIIAAVNPLDPSTYTPIFPGVAEFKNELGGTVFTFAGTPRTPFNYTTAFSFLTEPRKKQLISFLSETGNLPIYYPDDAEVYLKAGKMKNGDLFCAFTNISLDELENLTLVCEKEINEISMLLPNGEWQNVAFSNVDGTLVIDATAKTLHPVILKLK